MIKNLFRTFLIFLLIVTVPFVSYADYGSIQIDGYYDDWEDKPHIEVYNGNNPPESKINYVSLFRDEENVYVHVIFARKNNQGITNMTIKLYTDMGNTSYFLFPDLWFDGMDMSEPYLNEMEQLPEETPELILEEEADTGEEIGTETPDGSMTAEPEPTDQNTETEPTDQNAETQPTDQNPETQPTDQNTDTEQETVPETTEITDQSPDTPDQSPEAADQGGNADTGDNGGILYSNMDQSTYFVSGNNGQGKKQWNGTWSFTVWKNFVDWDDWNDWDDWDNWEDWDDWDDLFNSDDVQDWNNWFDWDDWSSVGWGYYTRNEGESDELELCIPLSSITRHYDGITEISMKIKKLGQQTVICTGVSTGAYAGVAAGAGVAMLSVGAYHFKKKRPVLVKRK